MWNTLPDSIKYIIIKMNPSLKSIHKIMFAPSLKSISFRKHDRMCVGCVRKAIFGTDDLRRRPSVRMYANVESEGEVCSVERLCRVACEMPSFSDSCDLCGPEDNFLFILETQLDPI